MSDCCRASAARAWSWCRSPISSTGRFTSRWAARISFCALYAIASTLAATAGRDLHRLLLRRKRETLHWHQRIVHRALRSRRTGLAGGLVARAIIRWPKDFHLNLAYRDWCIASGTASGADARLRDIEALGFGADPRVAARRRSLAAT